MFFIKQFPILTIYLLTIKKQKTKNKMKKFIIASLTIVALASCAGSNEEKVENKVDSVAVVPAVDTNVVVTDTVAAVDTVAAK